MAFLKNLVKGAVKATEIAAPIVVGAIGGPAAGAATKRVIGMLDKPKARGTFTPSSSGSLDESKNQDKERMRSQYPGIFGSGSEKA